MEPVWMYFVQNNGSDRLIIAMSSSVQHQLACMADQLNKKKL